MESTIKNRNLIPYIAYIFVDIILMQLVNLSNDCIKKFVSILTTIAMSVTVFRVLIDTQNDEIAPKMIFILILIVMHLYKFYQYHL